MLAREEGTVVSITSVQSGCMEIEVETSSGKEKALLYPGLTGNVNIGDRVLLNVTAVRKSLGTGGYHYVLANLSSPTDNCSHSETGHIVKLRYTPLQHTLCSIEEEDSPFHNIIDSFESLGGMPVLIGQVHSQLAPAAAAIKRALRSSNLVYIMTDSASLPINMSKLVAQLKAKGIINKTITIGQAFGGDFEAVNIYTALIAAKEVLNADIVVVCPGPGGVGTGTRFGYSSIEQGEIINSTTALGGRPVAIARISFADARARHKGVSHHTITALETVALCRCNLVLPMIDQSKLMVLQEQLSRTAIPQKHRIRIIDPTPGITEMLNLGIQVTTMGRGYIEDREFFKSAAAAGRFTAEILSV